MTAAAFAVLRRPDLWPTALRQIRRTTPRGWWKRRPFLPVPGSDYLAFRLQTHFGGDGPYDPDAMADASITYLEWCRSWQRGGTLNG